MEHETIQTATFVSQMKRRFLQVCSQTHFVTSSPYSGLSVCAQTTAPLMRNAFRHQLISSYHKSVQPRSKLPAGEQFSLRLPHKQWTNRVIASSAIRSSLETLLWLSGKLRSQKLSHISDKIAPSIYQSVTGRSKLSGYVYNRIAVGLLPL
jgi:hypothetical protein